MQTFYGFRLRALVAGSLVTASLICTVFALTKGQAQTKCKAKHDNAYDECCKQHNNCEEDAAGAWLKPCAEYADGVYEGCMKKYGYRDTNPSGPPTAATPPPSPSPVVRHPTSGGAQLPPSQSPTPSGIKPIHPISGPIINKSPVPSPSPTAQTIYAKPKPTPSPRPSQHKGHHG